MINLIRAIYSLLLGQIYHKYPVLEMIGLIRPLNNDTNRSFPPKAHPCLNVGDIQFIDDRVLYDRINIFHTLRLAITSMNHIVKQLILVLQANNILTMKHLPFYFDCVFWSQYGNPDFYKLVFPIMLIKLETTRESLIVIYASDRGRKPYNHI